MAGDFTHERHSRKDKRSRAAQACARGDSTKVVPYVSSKSALSTRKQPLAPSARVGQIGNAMSTNATDATGVSPRRCRCGSQRRNAIINPAQNQTHEACIAGPYYQFGTASTRPVSAWIERRVSTVACFIRSWDRISRAASNREFPSVEEHGGDDRHSDHSHTKS